MDPDFGLGALITSAVGGGAGLAALARLAEWYYRIRKLKREADGPPKPPPVKARRDADEELTIWSSVALEQGVRDGFAEQRSLQGIAHQHNVDSHASMAADLSRAAEVFSATIAAVHAHQDRMSDRHERQMETHERLMETHERILERIEHHGGEVKAKLQKHHDDVKNDLHRLELATVSGGHR